MYTPEFLSYRMYAYKLDLQFERIILTNDIYKFGMHLNMVMVFVIEVSSRKPTVTSLLM